MLLCSWPRSAAAGGEEPACEPEGDCDPWRPNILFILDYSSAMNETLPGGGTRFEKMIEATRDPGRYSAWVLFVLSACA